MREGFLKYTRNAFASLPKLNDPKILELGCGSGLVTLELARLTKAKIVGIDIDQTLLEILIKKIQEEGLTKQITIKRMDFLHNRFNNEEFDIIWEEGVIHIIGFKQSFKECYRVLKPGGYLVIAQAIQAINQNLNLIKESGFELIQKLKWPEGCWWTDFYKLLEQKISDIREGKEKSDFILNISAVEEEINMVKSDPNQFDCAHYILQKKTGV